MINIANNTKAYSEVYSFLNALGEEYINKIPKSVYSIIRDNRDKSYNPTYSKDQNVEKNLFSKEALALIAALNLQYFCTDEIQKKELKSIYLKNDEIEKEKYNPDNIFKNNQIKKEEPIEEKHLELVEYKEYNFIQKIINKIKEIFKRK